MSSLISVSDDRVFQFLCTEKSVRNWIAAALDVKLKYDDLRELSNGIVLCYLARKIDESLIPVIHEDLKHLYKMKENVTFFLQAVQEYGVPRHRLFQPVDLLEIKNKVNVLECLLTFAQLANKKGFKPAFEPIADDKANRPTVDAATMKTLKEQLSRVKESAFVATYRKEAPGLFQRKMAYLMGNQANYDQFVRRWTKLQALARGAADRRIFVNLRRMQAFRTKVAQEVLDTENSYTKSLKVCIDSYLNPLRDPNVKKPILDKAQIKTLFSDIEIIYSFNLKLRDDIEARIKNWSAAQRLGDLFLKISGFLKFYTNYVQNFDASLKLYEQLKASNKYFAQFIDQVRAQNVMDLPAFLIMPIQRIPRYSLLLQTLTKNTWADHADYKDLDAATNKINEVAIYLNERKRQFEAMQQLIVVQEMMHQQHGHMPIDLVTPTRSYIGRYEVEEPKKGDKTFFLFNDLILMGRIEKDKKKNTEVLEYKFSHKLEDVKFNSISDPKLGTVFEITKSMEDTILLRFMPSKLSPDHANKLLLDFQNALKALKDSKAARERRLSAPPPETRSGSTPGTPTGAAATSAPGSPATSAPGSPILRAIEEEEMTVEEQLRLKEEKKKLLKMQLEADSKAAAAASASAASAATSSPAASATSAPNGAQLALDSAKSSGNTGAAAASAMTDKPQVKRVIRSTESLVHIRAIVQTQIEEVDEAQNKKKKSSNPEQLSKTKESLAKELSELDSQINDAMRQLTPEEIEQIQKEEMRAREAERKARRKSNRKSIMQRLFGSKDKEDAPASPTTTSSSPTQSASTSPSASPTASPSALDAFNKKNSSRRSRVASSPPGTIAPITDDLIDAETAKDKEKEKEKKKDKADGELRSSSPGRSSSSSSKDKEKDKEKEKEKKSEAKGSSPKSRRESTGSAKPTIVVSDASSKGK